MIGTDIRQLVVTFEFKSFDGTVFHQSAVLDDWEQVSFFIEQLAARGITRYIVELAKDQCSSLSFVDLMQKN